MTPSASMQDQALSKIWDMKRTKAPKAVVVHVGTNDIRDLTDADTIVSKYETILDEIGKMFPRTKIILSNMMKTTNCSAMLSMSDISLKNTDLAGKNKSQDGIHLNTTGVSKFACSIRESVVRTLREAELRIIYILSLFNFLLFIYSTSTNKTYH